MKRRSQLKDENISSKLLGTDINSINIEKFRDLNANKKQKISLDGKLSVPILKTISNKFSPDIMFSINLAGQGIASIEALSECQNLIVLNVSENHISSLHPLSRLKELWLLNLAKNSIASIEAIRGLGKLVNLHLEGNSLTNVTSLKPLQECGQLQNLYLQNLSVTEINPICDTPDYRKNVLALLAKLRRLDGIPKSVEMNPGKELINNKKSLKIELKSPGSFFSNKFPTVMATFAPLLGESELKKSISECKESINSLQRLIKAALAK